MTDKVAWKSPLEKRYSFCIWNLASFEGGIFVIKSKSAEAVLSSLSWGDEAAEFQRSTSRYESLRARYGRGEVENFRILISLPIGTQRTD